MVTPWSGYGSEGLKLLLMMMMARDKVAMAMTLIVYIGKPFLS
jgi:hypothetical protein